MPQADGDGDIYKRISTNLAGNVGKSTLPARGNLFLCFRLGVIR